jgi:toxin FitB
LSGPILFDTNVIGEFGRTDGDPAVKLWLEQVEGQAIRVSSISWGELAFGVGKLPEGRRRSALVEWLGKIRAEFADRTLAFDTPAATAWGELRAVLRARGAERPGIDLQIAAIARCHRLAIATRNVKHFAGLGVDVIDPWAVIGSLGRKEREH